MICWSSYDNISMSCYFNVICVSLTLIDLILIYEMIYILHICKLWEYKLPHIMATPWQIVHRRMAIRSYLSCDMCLDISCLSHSNHAVQFVQDINSYKISKLQWLHFCQCRSYHMIQKHTQQHNAGCSCSCVVFCFRNNLAIQHQTNNNCVMCNAFNLTVTFGITMRTTIRAIAFRVFVFYCRGPKCEKCGLSSRLDTWYLDRWM